MPNVTVLGSNQANSGTQIWTVPGGFNQGAVYTAAQALASAISSAVTAGTDAPFYYSGTPPFALPDSQAGVLFVGGNYAGTGAAPVSSVQLFSGYSGLVDNSTAALTVTGSGGASLDHPVSIIAGTGGLYFANTTVSSAAVGAGTVVAAGGNNVVAINGAVSSGGGYDILLDGNSGSGNDTVFATSGNNTINAGTGHNVVDLGAGSNLLLSNGNDQVAGGTGASTISVVLGSVTYTGGSGSLYFLGGNSPSSVFGGSGPVTAFGGLGGGFFSGGTAGRNYLVGQASGNTTLVGAGSGDTLQSALGGDSLVAGPGSERIVGGPGLDTVSFGSGNDTFTAQGHYFPAPPAGEDVFQFNAASTGGGSDILSNFTSGLDTISLTGYSGTPTVSLLNTLSGATVSAQTTNPSTIPGGFYGNSNVVTVVKLSDNTTITLTGLSGFSHNISSSGLS